MFGGDFKPKKMRVNAYGDLVAQGSAKKRSLGIRDRQIVYNSAKGKCANPFCKKKIDFTEMQLGHKKAYAKGGATTISNSVCLCYKCNKLQGTDSWDKFIKKQQTARGQSQTTKEKKVAKPAREKNPRQQREPNPANLIFGGFKSPSFKSPRFRI